MRVSAVDDLIDECEQLMLEQIFGLAKDCIPQEVLDLYAWLSNIDKGLNIDAQLRWAGKYADVIVECLTKKHSWLPVNLETGEVVVSADRHRHNCFPISFIFFAIFKLQ